MKMQLIQAAHFSVFYFSLEISIEMQRSGVETLIFIEAFHSDAFRYRRGKTVRNKICRENNIFAFGRLKLRPFISIINFTCGSVNF